MRFQNRSKHLIDVIFPIALCFVFAASSLAVLLLAANLYASSVNDSQANDQSRTALSYISEKMRLGDNHGSARIEKIEQTDCLVLDSVYNDIVYSTYIYYYEGNLKELFIKDGVTVSLAAGKNIMELFSLAMTEPETGLFYFTAVNQQGEASSLYTAERSAQ